MLARTVEAAPPPLYVTYQSYAAFTYRLFSVQNQGLDLSFKLSDSYSPQRIVSATTENPLPLWSSSVDSEEPEGHFDQNTKQFQTVIPLNQLPPKISNISVLSHLKKIPML